MCSSKRWPYRRPSRALALSAGAEALKLVRLRLDDAMPLLLETIFVPAARCPGLKHENPAGQSR